MGHARREALARRYPDGMSHIAFSEVLDGKTAEWMDLVSEEQYRR
jgi:hypothetical protein